MDKKLHLISLGCTKNLIDSEVMLGKLKDYKITQDLTEADVILLNTCGFITSAKEESLNTIFEIDENRKENSIFVVTGCLTERYQNELQEELKDEVDIFTGVGDYDKIDELIEKRENRFTKGSFLITNEERVITGSTYHTYIKLSEGCNQQCSFCAIPSFRGKLQSRDIQDVIDEIKIMTDKGYYDFSFISQDTSSYLRDKNIKDGLIQLIDEVNKIDDVKSARILYLYPSTTTFKLIDKIADSEKFHNYFDMPIQHISDNLLKIMKRGSGENKVKELLNYMKTKENSFLRTGIIIGHPHETEKDFNILIKFLKEFNFDRISVFAYSDEEGTPAFDLKNKVEKDIIDKRINKIEKLIKKTLSKNLNNDLFQTFDVVIDGESDEHEYFLSAKKLLYAPEIDGEILINDSEIENPKYGKIYKAKITEVAGEKLVGIILK